MQSTWLNLLITLCGHRSHVVLYSLYSLNTRWWKQATRKISTERSFKKKRKGERHREWEKESQFTHDTHTIKYWIERLSTVFTLLLELQRSQYTLPSHLTDRPLISCFILRHFYTAAAHVFSIPCVRVRCEYYGCECIWARALCVCTTGVRLYLYTRMSESLQLNANICTDYSIFVVAFFIFAATIFIHAYFKSQITLSYRTSFWCIR